MFEPLILTSAHRHGISDADMLHAVRNVMSSYDLDDGFTMFVGPGANGELLEVGLVESDDGPVIVHAMKARPKYLR